VSETRVRKNETIDAALRRFKKSIAKDGVLAEVKKRKHYEKPSVKRKLKSEAARKRKFLEEPYLMNLNDRLNEDMKQAMRSQDKFRLSVIRMVRSSIKNIEIDQRKTLDDQEILDVLNREVKLRKDSLQEFEKAGRQDLVDQLKQELDILAVHMPKQLSEDEVKAIVQQTIQEVGASSKADMGKVMGALMPKVKGLADGKLVNQIVQQLLA
jgi:uncharacterized protein